MILKFPKINSNFWVFLVIGFDFSTRHPGPYWIKNRHPISEWRFFMGIRLFKILYSIVFIYRLHLLHFSVGHSQRCLCFGCLCAGWECLLYGIAYLEKKRFLVLRQWNDYFIYFTGNSTVYKFTIFWFLGYLLSKTKMPRHIFNRSTFLRDIRNN